ncbi:hypothetical protein RIF29_24385 [Crotalaria pallida]|uniref:Polygalacturonase n=1 Tax=Crotalaria pallida TaxID=3830 RepID=A0AAN9ERW1_CROPI
MQGVVVIFFILSFASFCSCNRRLECYQSKTIFNVMDYGAIGDGLTDDSEAFLKAWGEACSTSDGNGTLEVPPEKTFLLKPINFTGPCQCSSVHFKLEGNIVAPNSTDAWEGLSRLKWIQFMNIDGLVFNGGGQIDGQGSVWWKSCYVRDCYLFIALKFIKCNNLQLSDTRHINSAKGHIIINHCNHTTIFNLTITAPENSPNTDGFDIRDSNYITLTNTTIGTGDDCIAINGGTSNITITNMTCGPGHGISIGSLGKNGAYETVENVYVGHSNINGTTNGLRIKTWEGGRGYVRNVTYEHINITRTKNPIIINQKYKDIITNEDQDQGPGIEITGVTYNEVHGTSNTKVAINLGCSQSKGCNEMLMDTVNLTAVDSLKTKTISICENAKGKAKSVSPEVQCLA